MFVLTLQPVAYIVEETNAKGVLEWTEIPFAQSGAVRGFEATYLCYGLANRMEPNVSRQTWLEKNIIWEPVDGQYVVAACKRAKLEYRTGLIDESEYESVFAQRKA